MENGPKMASKIDPRGVIFWQKEQKKREIISDIIKILSKGYYTSRTTRTKNALKAIFVSYLDNINMVNIDKINQDLIDNSLNEISGSSNFTFNQLINLNASLPRRPTSRCGSTRGQGRLLVQATH